MQPSLIAHLGLAVFLLITGIVATVLAARDQTRAPSEPVRWLPLALFAAAGLALIARHPPLYYYKGALLLALLVAALATVFDLIPGNPPVVRAGNRAVIYLILASGFLFTAGRAFWSVPGLVGFVLGAGAVFLVYAFLHRRLRWMWLTVILYTATVALVVGGAAALVAVQPALWSVLGLVGALLYTGSDAPAAWARWRAPIGQAPMAMLLLTAIGGLLLGLSVWGDVLMRLWPPS